MNILNIILNVAVFVCIAPILFAIIWGILISVPKLEDSSLPSIIALVVTIGFAIAYFNSGGISSVTSEQMKNASYTFIKFFIILLVVGGIAAAILEAIGKSDSKPAIIITCTITLIISIAIMFNLPLLFKSDRGDGVNSCANCGKDGVTLHPDSGYCYNCHQGFTDWQIKEAAKEYQDHGEWYK